MKNKNIDDTDNINLVFCIMMTKSEQINVNKMNQILEKIQMDILEKQKKEQVLIRKAFVYNNTELNALSFEEASMDQVYYMDYIKRGAPLTHTLLRSMLVLEEASNGFTISRNNKSKTILCMIADRIPDRVESSQMIDIMKAFENLTYLPVLVQTEEMPETSFDQHVRKLGGQVYLINQFIKQKTISFI